MNGATDMEEVERLYRDETSKRLAYEVAVARHDGIMDTISMLAQTSGMVDRVALADVAALLHAARRRCEETRVALTQASRTTHAAVMALTTKQEA